MKKLIFPLMFLLVVVYACKKDVAPDNSIGASNLPAKAAEYISQNYPDQTVTSAIKMNDGTDTYIVTLNSNDQLAFDLQGSFLGAGTVQSNESTSGTNSNFSDGPTPSGLAEFAPGRILTLRFVPWSISQYVKNNYDGYNMELIQLQNVCSFGNVYVAMLNQGKNTRVTLLFGTDGQYMARAVPMPYSLAPNMLQHTILNSFPGYSVRPNIDEIFMSDGRTLWAVFLMNQGRNYVTLINEDGTSLCSQEIL